MASLLLSLAARRLEGKVALITGGASGIGKCAAKLFASHGAKVVVADIQDDLGNSLCRCIPNSSYVHCDVRDETHIKNTIATTISLHGKLDIMFNNAGIVGEVKSGITGDSKENFDNVISTNVTGVFLGIKHAAIVMIPARMGSIISTASTSSIVGGDGSVAYTSSKHAVVGLTKVAAVELGQFGIRVNCVSPFVVATPPVALTLGASVEEIEGIMSKAANLKGVILKEINVANAALYLASDESKYVSGHNLSIDGGFTITNPSLNQVLLDN